MNTTSFSGPLPAADAGPLAWSCLHFGALSVPLLYRILALRSAVFVLEQACAYLDPDGDDEDAWFIVGRSVVAGSGGKAGPVYGAGQDDETGGDRRPVLASARLLAPGVRYDEASIGRVCTARAARGQGLGRALMREALAGTARLFPGHAVRISAQAHLAAFYGSLGFEVVSAPYDEDGIPHVAMRRAAGPLR